MIVIHIATFEEKQAEEIVDFLLEEKLIMDAFISHGSRRRLGEDGTIVEDLQFQITGKARAILFDKIDQIIREKYKSNEPELYSVPIVNMDWGKSPPFQD